MVRPVRLAAFKLMVACALAVSGAALLIAVAGITQAESANGQSLRRLAAFNEHERASGAVEASAVVTSFMDQPMCRFGYGVTQNPINEYPQNDIASLRGGWYLNFMSLLVPTRPFGIEFAQMVRPKQLKVSPVYNAPYVVPYTYTLSLPLSSIAANAAANPGALWLIGNEIDRRDWDCGSYACGQDEITPELYAEAYHDVYTAIKTADPTAQVAIGGVVEVTPLRLKYLDRIWTTYLARYGTPMPADVWNMHPYMLDEVRNRPGADIPAGLTETVGVLYGDWQNDNLDAFKQQVVMFRQWMAGKGQQNKPLIISEFGVLLPTWYQDQQGNFYTLARVKNFMYGSLDYLLTAQDATLGYPADDYRLVQRWNWFSLDWPPQFFNGNLFSYTTKTIQQLGLDWKAYVNDASKPFGPPLNLKMLPASYTLSPVDGLGRLTATVKLQVSNAGFLNWTSPFNVQLTQMDDTVLAQTTLAGLRGCGNSAAIQFTLANLTPNPNAVFYKAKIDPSQSTPDADFSDNTLVFPIITDPRKTYIPLVSR